MARAIPDATIPVPVASHSYPPVSIFIHDNSTEFRLEVRGVLDSRAGAELLEIYRTASTSLRGVPGILDLRRVERIDDSGHDSIDYLKAQGLVCRHAEPRPESTCPRTALRHLRSFLTGVPQPALVPESCRIRARFSRK